MCSRGGVGVVRGSSGLQPMKATVPFQLGNNSSRPQQAPRDPKTVSEKQLWGSLTRQNLYSQPLDAIVGPYLHGHWPKDGVHYKKDMSTQTPASWVDDQQNNSSGGIHKRSASWGSAAHKEVSRQRQSAVVLGGSLDRRRIHALTQAGSGTSPWLIQSQPVPIPLNSVHTRLRHSEEKLDQELETIFKHNSVLNLPDFLVPNGRRGPVPPYSNCSSCSDHQRCPSSPSSPFSSPASSVLSSSSPHPPPATSTLESDREVCGEDAQSALSLIESLSGDSGTPSRADLSRDKEETSHTRVVGEDEGLLSCPCWVPMSGEDGPLELLSCSPRPNKSVCFQREPPEGCEKVPVCEEAMSFLMSQSQTHLSCPDPGKVNFKPRRDSTFFPVSLHKPPPLSMDFLFCSLSVSPISERHSGTATPSP